MPLDPLTCWIQIKQPYPATTYEPMTAEFIAHLLCPSHAVIEGIETPILQFVISLHWACLFLEEQA